MSNAKTKRSLPVWYRSTEGKGTIELQLTSEGFVLSRLDGATDPIWEGAFREEKERKLTLESRTRRTMQWTEEDGERFQQQVTDECKDKFVGTLSKDEAQCTLKLGKEEFALAKVAVPSAVELAAQWEKRSSPSEGVVLRAYGALGIEAKLRCWNRESKEQFFSLESAPKESPWKLEAGESLDAFVRRTFAPLATKIPKFIDALAKSARVILVMHRPEREKNFPERKPGWYLFYAVERGPTADPQVALWLGGAPMKRPRRSKKLETKKIEFPAELYQLYSVHNGLGVDNGRCFGTSCMRSAKQIALLGVHKHLLELYCDDGGHRFCFRRTDQAFVDWDRETHEETKKPFWRFVEEDLRVRLLGSDG